MDVVNPLDYRPLRNPWLGGYDPARPTICIDLDGVIADTMGAITRRAADYGLEVGMPASYAYEEYPEEIRRFVFSTFGDYVFYRDVPLMPGADAALWLLARTHNIVVVTARGMDYNTGRYSRLTERITWDWIRQHDLPVSAMVITGAGAKLHVVQSQFPNCRAMVEDKGSTAEAFAGAGFRSYLIDYPYNQDVEHPSIIRVDTLGKIAANESALVMFALQTRYFPAKPNMLKDFYIS